MINENDSNDTLRDFGNALVVDGSEMEFPCVLDIVKRHVVCELAKNAPGEFNWAHQRLHN